MHLKPAIGRARPVGAAIVDHLFSPNTTGRIPVVGITGSRGTDTVAALTAHLLATAQRTVGLACSQGFFVGKRRVDAGNHDRHESGRMVLMNPRTEVAVIENGPTTILNQGLAYDRCQIGVVTDLSEPERWRDFYVRDEDQLFSVLRSQIDVVLPEGCGVLNADQPEVLRMAELCDGNVVLFGSIRRSAGMQAHLDAGGQAVCIDDGVLEVMDGNVVQDRLPLITDGDEARWLAAAVAAVLALGVPTSVILAGLEGLALRNAQLIAAAAAAT
jgi:cyanophycin synthetase